MSRTSQRKPQQIGLYQMIRDILVAAMNKGQFPLAIVSVIVLTMILKMPAEDVGKLTFRVLEALENGKLLGWALMFLSQAGWLIHARSQRRRIVLELNRVARERNEWQSRALDKKLKSSEVRS